MAVGGDGKDLAGVALGQNLLHNLHQHGLGGPALLDDKAVGALHLRGAAVEEASLILAQVQLIHHLLHVPAVGAHQVDGLLPVLLPAPLKDVAEGIQQDIIAGVPAIGLVAQEEGGPLLVGHGGGAGVRQHIHGQHSGGESELVVMRGLQGPLTLLHGDGGQVADGEGEVMRSGNVQGIVRHVLVHFDLPP